MKETPVPLNSVLYSLFPRFLRDPAGPQTAERELGCIFSLRLPESLHHMLSEACFSALLPASRGLHNPACH